MTIHQTDSGVTTALTREEKCQRCGDGPDPDLRTLWMACWYERWGELGLPFEKLRDGDREFYTLRVCKQCRGNWLTSIKQWFHTRRW